VTVASAQPTLMQYTHAIMVRCSAARYPSW